MLKRVMTAGAATAVLAGSIVGGALVTAAPAAATGADRLACYQHPGGTNNERLVFTFTAVAFPERPGTTLAQGLSGSIQKWTGQHYDYLDTIPGLSPTTGYPDGANGDVACSAISDANGLFDLGNYRYGEFG
ncbi:hypothetical protein [Williamsia sp. CHRR-6]|uniref:hypothetical protein n=1 Tax=Williamsia sp. CHRR-6 TaxID=2835871 RepID=UPI001BDAF927|nr:hypothetical protein [Williamsia sp. CHRR-6]MBT0567401.1 hypothetical protein [Williamsia sp. CHRR-6]